MVDMVVHRHELRATLARLCRLLTDRSPARRGHRALPRDCRRGAYRRAGVSLTPPAPRRWMRFRRACWRCIRSASICRWTGCSACSPRSAIPSAASRPSSMWPAPTARARPSHSCAPCWRRPASACMSIRRRISCASTSAFVWRAGRLATDDELSLPMRSPSASASMAMQPITVFEIETAAAFLLFARHEADVAAARSRARRTARRHQRDRQAARQRHDAGGDGSRRVSRRYAGEDRVREGRHHQARRAGRGRAAGPTRPKR